jgi:hypothetical protein
MVTAIDAPTQRTQRGANAGRHAREEYSWRRVAGRLAALYESHGNERASRRHY